MVTMATGTVLRNSAGVFTLVLACTNFTHAKDWELTPKLKLKETYSDNILLTPDQQKSAWVTQSSVILDSKYRSKSTDFSFLSTSSYAMYSHNSKINDDYHKLDADLAIELWPNGLSLINSIKLENQSRNSARNALADIVSGDTVRVENYDNGLQYNVNSKDIIILSNIIYQTRKSEDNIGEREGVIAQFNSRNGSSARSVFWDIESSLNDLKNNNNEGKLKKLEVKLGLLTKYKINPFLRYYDEDNKGTLNVGGRTAESSAYGLGVRWLISPRLHIDISYNDPVGNKVDINNKKQKEYINTNLVWQPSARTRLEAGVSERFYGNSYNFAFVQRSKRLTNQINYVEDVQALTRNNFVPVAIGRFWCPGNQTVVNQSQCIAQNSNTNIPNGYILTTLSELQPVEDNIFSLSKMLTWTSELALSRTTFTINAQHQRRQNLNTNIKSRDAFINFKAARKLSRSSNLALSLSYTNNNLQIDTPVEREDRYRRYQVEYNKSLNSRLSYSISLSHLNRSSTEALQTYKEGRISASITKGF